MSGNRYAAVHLEDMEEWAGLLSRIGDWFGHAGPEMVEDWARFFEPNRLSSVVVAVVLGEWPMATQALVDGDG